MGFIGLELGVDVKGCPIDPYGEIYQGIGASPRLIAAVPSTNDRTWGHSLEERKAAIRPVLAAIGYYPVFSDEDQPPAQGPEWGQP